MSRLKYISSSIIKFFSKNYLLRVFKVKYVYGDISIKENKSYFLIGNHVLAAPKIKKSGIEVIPTGYILINSGVDTSVSYMSSTVPIPYNKKDIALATIYRPLNNFFLNPFMEFLRKKYIIPSSSDEPLCAKES